MFIRAARDLPCPGRWGRARVPLLPLLAAAAVASPAIALACSICACGDPLLSASDPAALGGRLRLQLDVENLRADAGTEGQPGFTDELTQWSYRLNVAYRPIERLALSATVPFVSKTIRTVGGGERVTASSLDGLGDLELAGRWAIRRWLALGVGRAHELALSAGTSIPTGADGGHGDHVDPHGALGIGGWGPFVGVHYAVDQGRWLGFASVSARVRTEAARDDGARYKFGDALHWSVHGQLRPVRRVAVDLGIDGRAARADRATEPDGTVEDRVANTGGTVLSVAPGAYLNVVGRVWLFGRAQIPFLKELSGVQDVPPSFTTGVQVEVL